MMRGDPPRRNLPNLDLINGSRRQMTTGHLVEAKASTYVGQGFSLDQPERLPAITGLINQTPTFSNAN